jgi:hypothetical protein
MRSIQNEDDRWQLADALFSAVPTGTGGFVQIMDAARNAGVDAGLTVNTLRLYRDTAARWPTGDRDARFTFSAHREVLAEMKSPAEGRALLESVLKANNASGNPRKAGKVSVADVRGAIAVRHGKVPVAQRKPKKGVTVFQAGDMLDDLRQGGKRLMAVINASTSNDDLDRLHKGLSVVLQHVDVLRSKANTRARTAASSKRAANVVAAKPVVVAPKTTSKSTPTSKSTARKAGDMRRKASK